MRIDVRGTVVAAVCRDRSTDVLYEADRHAQAFDCGLVICHVAANATQVEEFGATLRARAGAAIGRPARDLEIMVTVGDPATEILRIAHERGAQLVVVGSPRHGRLLGLLRGCTFDRVLHKADTPVLVARECPHTGRMMVATDLAHPGFPIIAAAHREASAFDARVVALHAVEPFDGTSLGIVGSLVELMPPRYRVRVEIARARLDAALREIHLDAEPQVIIGSRERTILGASDDTAAQLLVIGMRRQRRAWRNASSSIARNAHCSVLVVPVAAMRGELPAAGSALQWRPT